MVVIFIPAALVYGVLALDDDFVSCLEGSLAEIASLLDAFVIEAHVLSGVGNDVFAEETSVKDEWYDELEDEVNNKDDNDAKEESLENDECQTVAVYDNGIVDIAKLYGSGERGEEGVCLGIVEVNCEFLVVAAIDFIVRILEGEAKVGHGGNVYSPEHLLLVLLPFEMGEEFSS